MSCSIDITAFRRGSILMEFVLVLPIYIFLFGSIFLIGEIGLNAIRISVGDRCLAMDAGDREGYSFAQFDSMQMGEEVENIHSKMSCTYRADESFKGAWAWEAAGRTTFSYKLRSWGSALVSYPFLNYGGSTSGGGILATLVGGGDVVFHSKDFSLAGTARAYNYYTLKRTDLSRKPEAYRNWNPNQLVEFEGSKQYWESGVYDELFADSDCERLDSDGLKQNADENPNPPDGVSEYKRDSQFVKWSE